MNEKRFGRKLKELRKAKGLTSEKLAAQCFINDGYMRQLENGLRMPSLSLLLTFCDVLGTTPNYLFEYTEDDENKEILDRVSHLSPMQRNLMIRMLDTYIDFSDNECKEI